MNRRLSDRTLFVILLVSAGFMIFVGPFLADGALWVVRLVGLMGAAAFLGLLWRALGRRLPGVVDRAAVLLVVTVPFVGLAVGLIGRQVAGSGSPEVLFRVFVRLWAWSVLASVAWLLFVRWGVRAVRRRREATR